MCQLKSEIVAYNSSRMEKNEVKMHCAQISLRSLNNLPDRIEWFRTYLSSKKLELYIQLVLHTVL